MSSTFYTSKDVPNVSTRKTILGRHKKIAKRLFNYFKKDTEAVIGGVILKSYF